MPPSQARKLGLRAGQRITLDAPPPGWALRDPPGGLAPPDPGAAADVIVAFFRSAAQLPARLPGLGARVHPAGAIWAAWPRRAAGHRSDITDNVVRACALDLGLVDVKVAALDDDWSALRLVWRAASRAPTHPSPDAASPGHPLLAVIRSGTGSAVD
ncbi:MAG TPA: hypothetical protein VH478_21400 [Trebonia sp.]|nr:hypothetical protein [Trebonia sp.]